MESNQKSMIEALRSIDTIVPLEICMRPTSVATEPDVEPLEPATLHDGIIDIIAGFNFESDSYEATADRIIALMHGATPALTIDEVGHEPTPGMLHAAMFTKDVASYQFGVGHENTSKVLHALADNVAARNALVQTARVDSIAGRDNWLMTTLTITFAEKRLPV